MDIAWGTAETAGLTERMALRVAKCIKDNQSSRLKSRDRIPLGAIIVAGLGDRQNRNNRPAWMPTEAQLNDYDDDWTNWLDVELAAVEQRLKIGIDRKLVYAVFSVPPSRIPDLDRAAFGIQTPPKEDYLGDDEYEIQELPLQESAEFDDGVFTQADIFITDDRRFANRRYLEYAERVDASKPQNQTLIKSLVIIEVELQKATRDLNSLDDKKKKLAAAALSKLNADFSKAAENLVLLEKQSKTEPEQENLDDVIIRTKDIRRHWRSMEIEHQLAANNLYELMARMHKTDVGEDDETGPVELPVVEQKKSNRTAIDVRADMALTAIRASEAKQEKMVVESDG